MQMVQNRRNDLSEQNSYKIEESKSPYNSNINIIRNELSSVDNENELINEKVESLSNIQKSYFTNTSINNSGTNIDVSRQNSSIDMKLKKTINQQLEISETRKHLESKGSGSIINSKHLSANNSEIVSKISSSRKSVHNEVKSRDSSSSKHNNFMDKNYNVDKLLNELVYQQSTQKSSNKSSLMNTFKSPLRRDEDSLNYSSTPTHIQAKYSKPSVNYPKFSEKSSSRKSLPKNNEIYKNTVSENLNI